MSTLKSNTIRTLTSSDSLLFTTNATERLRISSNGNIGIGTSSPSTLLDVSGTVKSTGLYCTGNVGIGTASPSVALDVVGTVKNTNPVFSVTYTTTPSPVETTVTINPLDLIFDSAVLNVGNCFNTTNGRFTAPVDGYYFFSASIFFYINNTDNKEYGAWHFAKNGTKNHNHAQSPYTPAANYISYYTVSGTSIQQLNAGEYINIKYNGSPYPTGYSQWNGFLIG
jgi:hypothetical protein